MDTSPPGTVLPAAVRAYHHIKRGILEQLYPGGSVLTEGEIADAVGVSRTPVREALLRLESEGLVGLHPKRGALVLPVSVQELNDVIEARTLVEGHAAGRAWPARARLAGELAPPLAGMREALAAGDPIAFTTADRAFHAAVVSAGGNQILADLYHRLRDRQMRMGVAAIRLAPERMGRALTEHTAMLDALADTGTAQADWVALVHAHIGTAAGYLRGLW
jgi:DNA-binding GntR family transcriptional regulator